MIVTIPSELELELLQKARAAGLTIEDYIEHLIHLDLLSEEPQPLESDETDPEFAEIRSSVI